MSQPFMNITEVADSVPVLNRMDVPNRVIHDRQELVWAPGETKYLPRTYAHWFINKSTKKRDLNFKSKVQTLVIVGSGKDESPLHAAQFAGPQQLVEKPWYDKDGTALKEVYLDANATGAEGVIQRVEAKEQQQHEAQSAEVRAAVIEKTADTAAEALASLSDDEPASA